MKTCPLCNGAGLIGNGPNPHLLEGATHTCTDCAGTGKVADEAASAADSSTFSDAPVDNQPTTEKPKPGILERIGIRLG